MPLNFMEGFDYVNTYLQMSPKWYDVGSCSFPAGRFGGKSLQIISSGSTYHVAMHSFNDGTTDTLVLGFAIYKLSLAQNQVVTFRDGTTDMLVIQLQTDGFFKAVVSGSPVSTSTAAITAPAWHYLEVAVRLHASLGTVAWQIDGIAAGSDGPMDTITAGSACDNIDFEGAPGNSIFVDDVYLGDDSDAFGFLGDSRVTTLQPNADDAVEFTRSAGSTNYENIDETPLSEVDYNESNTSGHVDTFDFASFAVPGTDDIHGVQVNGWATKPDSGVASMKYVVKSGGTEYSGAEISIPTSYARYATLWDEDPDTAAAWTTAGLDAAQFGYERV